MSDTAAHDANITFEMTIIQAGKQSAAILVEPKNLPKIH